MRTTNYADKLQRTSTDRTTERLSDYLSVYFREYFSSPNISVLDVGCGVGLYMEAIKNMGIEDVEGIEIDKSCFLVCEKKGLRVINGNILNVEALNIKKKFDIVVSFDVIEHLQIEDVPLYIKNCLDLLKEDGRLIIRTPSMNNPFSLPIRYIDITHRIGFTDDSLRQLMDEFGKKKFSIFFADIFVIKDRHFSRRLLKFFAKILLRLMDFAMQVYYYIYNSTWQNMGLDIIMVIEKNEE